MKRWNHKIHGIRLCETWSEKTTPEDHGMRPLASCVRCRPTNRHHPARETRIRRILYLPRGIRDIGSVAINEGRAVKSLEVASLSNNPVGSIIRRTRKDNNHYE